MLLLTAQGTHKTPFPSSDMSKHFRVMIPTESLSQTAKFLSKLGYLLF